MIKNSLYKQRSATIKVFLILLLTIFFVGLSNATVTTDGVETIFGDYKIITFTGNGTFNVSGGTLNVSVLVVAGGGSGGSGTSRGGGGGAGGINYTIGYNISIGNYNVVVGSGGIKENTGGSTKYGNNGTNSSFGNLLIAYGGGAGAPSDNLKGSFGGSGGGASGNGGASNSISGQGNNGGTGGSNWDGSGGGGAGAVGQNAPSPGNIGGAGGDGLSFTIYNGTTLWYAGGGGGGGATIGVGGKGGGANGSSNTNGSDAIANFGGGGGGGGGATHSGGNGGSGIVIIRYLPLSPILVNLTSPSNNSILTTSSNLFTVNLSLSGTNYSYQWNNNTYNIWYNNGTLFNSAIITGLSTNVTNISTLFNISLGNYLWNSYACYSNNTYYNCSWSNNGNYSFTVGFLISSVTYNSNTIPTASETFLLQGTKTIFTSSVSAVLWYNGTSYPSTVILSGNNVNIINTIAIPSNTSGNKTFYWTINSFGTSGGVTQNSSTYYQSIGNLSIYSCTSPPSNGLALNFSLYDESTKLKLNGSLESTFTYFAYGSSGNAFQTYNFNSINQSKSNWMFCINATGNSNVSFSGTFSYYADYYDRREYIFSNAVVGNFTQNIPLYLSLIADTEVVTVTVTDQNYNPIPNALVNMQEWNVGTDTYSTIGMFYTDSSGNGIVNLELYNLWYRAIVSINGVIVKVTDVRKLASTAWPIIVNNLGEDPYTLFGSISHGLVFDNNTNITTFSWLDNSGYVNYGCLDIRNKTVLGYKSVHTECVSSVAGTINYMLSGDGDYEVVGTIYLLPIYNVSKVTDSMYIRLGTPYQTSVVSKYGKVLSFIFIGVFATLGVSAGSPILGIFLLVISIFISGKLGWLNITESILWGIISIAIIIVFRQTRRGA